VQPFGKRGEVAALSKTRTMLAHLVTAVRRVVSSPRNQTLPRATIEMFLKNSARYAAEQAVLMDPSLKSVEQGQAEIAWRIDEELGKTYVVEIRFSESTQEWLASTSTRELLAP
jgi:hypothetical protein